MKGNSRQKSHFGLVDSAGYDIDDFRFEYLGEFEPICETALARESGP
jgi:hypothetical protein